MRALPFYVFGVLICLLAAPLQAQGLLEKLEQSLGRGAVSSVAESEDETPGYLGIAADELQAGFIGVVKVDENSPADRVGIRRGDQILAINGRRINTLDDLDDIMRVPVGTRLDMLTRRAGEERRVQLTLTQPPAVAAEEEASDELPPPLPADLDEDLRPPTRGSYPTLGVSVVDVSQESRNQYRFTTPQGAVITRIVEGSPAAEYGLPLGGVIVAVDGQRIDSSDDLVATIQVYKPGDEVELMYFRGNQIARKKVRLGHGAPPVVAPTDAAPSTRQPSDPPLRLGSRPDRPLLNRLERALDEIVPSVIDSATGSPRKRAADLAPVSPAPPPADGVADLRLQIETLQKQLQLMQQRIQQLEEALNKKSDDK
jgi:hypothetical protein